MLDRFRLPKGVRLRARWRRGRRRPRQYLHIAPVPEPLGLRLRFHVLSVGRRRAGCQCADGLRPVGASYPPYDTVTTVPCGAVPTPLTPFGDAGPPPGFPAIPAICDAGSTCTEVTWNTCMAQQTGSCTVDSDAVPRRGRAGCRGELR